MADYPSFGVLLARLADRRKLDVGGLSRLAEVSEAELRAVFDGVVPGRCSDGADGADGADNETSPINRGCTTGSAVSVPVDA
jgi:hypothetical protein